MKMIGANPAQGKPKSPSERFHGRLATAHATAPSGTDRRLVHSQSRSRSPWVKVRKGAECSAVRGRSLPIR